MDRPAHCLASYPSLEGTREAGRGRRPAVAVPPLPYPGHSLLPSRGVRGCSLTAWPASRGGGGYVSRLVI